MTAATAKRLPRYVGLAARALAWSLVLVAVVTLVAWGVIESTWLRQRARAAVVTQASRFLEREVSVERLDFDLFPPRATVYQVRIAGADPSADSSADPSADPSAEPGAEPLATAERLTVGIGPGLLEALRGRGVLDLASIDVVRPEIRLEIAADGSTNLPPAILRLLEKKERREGGFEVRLGALFVAGGRLHLDEHSVPLDFEAEGVRAALGRLAGAESSYHLELESRRISARLPDLQPADAPRLGGRLSLRADLGGGAVEVSDLELTGPLADLEGSGTYREGRLEARLAGLVDSALVAALGWADELGAEGGELLGSVSLDGRVAWDEDGWEAASDVVTTALRAGEYDLPAITGRLEANGRGAEIDGFSGDARSRAFDLDLSGSRRGGRLDLAARGWVESSLGAEMGWVEGLDGRVGVDGDLTVEEGEWQFTADVSSEELRYETWVVRQASARLSGSPRVVRAESIAASAAGGSVGGAVRVDLAATPPGPAPVTAAAPAAAAGPQAASPARQAEIAAAVAPLGYPRVVLDLTARDVEVRRFVEMADLPVEGLAGRVSGELLYAFETGRAETGRGRGELRFGRLDVPTPRGAEQRVVQLSGRLPVEIDGGVFRVRGAELSTAEQRLGLAGELMLAPPEGPGPRTRLEFELATRDPRRILRLLPAIYASEPDPVWEPQRGRGTVDGTLIADPDGFRLALDLDLTDVAVAATEADRVTGTLIVDSAGVQAVDLVFLGAPGVGAGEGAGELSGEDTGDAENAWQRRLAVTASVPFGTSDEAPPPGFEPPPFSVRIDTVGWPLGDAAPWLPFELPADGLADVVVELSGDLDAVRGSVEGSFADLAVGGLEVEGTLEGALSFDPERLQIARATLATPAGPVQLSGTYGLAGETLDLDLAAERLDLALPPFADWVEAPIGGLLTLRASVDGTFGEPLVTAELIGDELVLGDTPLGRNGQSRLDIDWGEDGRLTASGSLLGLLRVEGGGRLDASGTDVELAVTSQRVGSLLELALASEVEETSGGLDGTLRIRNVGDELAAELTLDRLTLVQPDRTLANLEPVVVSWREGVLRLESLFMGEERSGTDLFVAGDLVGPQGELDLVLQSTVDARWLALYLPGIEVSGRMNALGVVRGSLAEPALDGQADLEGGRMIVSGFPHAFERMSGLVFFYPGRVVVDSGRARLAGGTVTADGAIEIDEETNWGYELRLRGRELDLRYPEDWRLQGDMELTVASKDGGREITGVVTLEQAAYLRDFKLGFMGLLRSIFERRAVVVGETDELLVQTRLNILVRGPEALEVDTSLAELQGSLDFSVRGSLAEPVLLGDVRLLRGGKIDIGGAEYTVERGTLSFANPFLNQPHVDLVASARVKEYDVRLNVFGPLEDLETSFSSNPPLADVDIVSLLATGSADTLGSLGRTDPTASQGSGAESFLAGQAASLAGERVGTLLGLDQVQISPLTGGTADLSTARLTVGKRLGQDLFVTYSYDPSRSQEEIYELSWQIMPSLALILTRSDQGSFALDLEWNTTF